MVLRGARWSIPAVAIVVLVAILAATDLRADPFPDPPPTDPDLAPYLAMLTESGFMTNENRLVAFVSRHTWSDSTYAVSNWIGSRFTSFGYTDVRYDSLTAVAYWGSKRVANVIAVKPGHLHPERQVIVCAHYDAHAIGTPLTYAPGADDNGSGMSGVLEIARAIAHVPLENTVRFIGFGAEEQVLQGSWHYADSVAARGDSIVLVLNMDMIANYVSGDWQVKIGEDAVSHAHAQQMAGLAAQYTTLVPIVGDAEDNSDHWPFMTHGIPALSTEEHVRSACWHRPCDVWSSAYSSAYAKQVLRMVMAELLTVSPPYSRTSVEAPGTVEDTAGGIRVALQPNPGPGPFTIRYAGAPSTSATASVIDVRGRVVAAMSSGRALTHGHRDAPGATGPAYGGEVRWTGRDDGGLEVTPGIYFVHLAGTGWSRTSRLVVIH